MGAGSRFFSDLSAKEYVVPLSALPAIMPAESLLPILDSPCPTAVLSINDPGMVKSTGYLSDRASYSASPITGPVSSHVTSTCTECESSCSHARSWLICLMDAPTKAMVAHRPAMPPGRSGTTQLKRMRRPSLTRPRSSTLPSVLVSMLPPHRHTTTFLPASSGSLPAMHAAMPAAPAPSCTSFSHSTSRSSATEMSFSLTCARRSTRCRSTSKERGPTVGTARPSARVGPGISTRTGIPAAMAAAMEAQRSGSTPTIITLGLMVLTASAMPAMRPPPPTGTMMASTFFTSSRISSPTLPAPAMMLKSSKPLMYFMPSFSTYVRAASAASAMVSPLRMTRAPSARHLVILVSGAMDGMSTVTGMPSSAPWYASASAWLPAEAATTPRLRCSSSSASRALRAPRSLNDPVACSHSCLR
mmetsp:Transcript_17211/g.42356  ORF Transcript_17211/g.42356 Transcript_17211/m.42356 type:complete len:417 (-) Transcript_17211:535-1785(-)